MKVKDVPVFLFVAHRFYNEKIYEELTRSLSDQDIILAMNDRNGEVRTSAVCALMDRQGKDVNEALISAIKDPDDSVRYSAIKALKGRSGEAFDNALILATQDKEIRLLNIVVDALLDRQGESIDEALIMLATSDQHLQVRYQVRYDAVRALMDRQGEKISQALILATKDPERQVRDVAVDALKNRERTKEIDEALELAIKSEQNGVYDTVEERMVKLDDKALVSLIINGKDTNFLDSVFRDYAVYELRRRGKVNLLLGEIVEL